MPTALDRSEHEVLRLQHTIRSLERSLHTLEQRVCVSKLVVCWWIVLTDLKLQQYQERARHEFKRMNKSSAVRHFKMVKLLEASHKQRSDALSNLLHTLEKLKSLQVDSEILNAYSMATNVLRLTRQELGLDAVDKAADIVDEWKECMEEQNELDRLIAEPSSISEAEQVELEHELSALTTKEGEGAFGMESLSQMLPVIVKKQDLMQSTPSSQKVALEN